MDLFAQQTTSAEGFAGQTFNTHVPTRCAQRNEKHVLDLHVSADNDNNAGWPIAFCRERIVNLHGRYVYVAAATHWKFVVATEQSEPQAILAAPYKKSRVPGRLREVRSRRQ